ncbi:hypothetical protein [Parabacteroides sp. PF5-9]|uniref:hypothetical protein n=1 Tax=Parabacteroides sp. PF5-9 TaxID=1742404 RepID=UPI0024731FF4|nr:hypothetical protein [Parabacteroides sp. PF5-9]MDH6357287.1 hypothetical protein [Parabacteroides sp. PF5-9]
MQFKTTLTSVMTLLCVTMGLLFSGCSDNDKETDPVEGKNDITGTWIASSGKYDLTLKITKSAYDLRITQPGKGGMYDIGRWEVGDDGRLILINEQEEILAMGGVINNKLSLTFVNSLSIGILGLEAASNLTFTRSNAEEEDPGDDDDSVGLLVIQNLSDSRSILSFVFYDEDGNLLDTDDDELEAGYQFGYEIPVGNYKVKITDTAKKSYTSKVFKIVKDKATVLEYDGSSFTISATGIDPSEFTRSVKLKRGRF